jgi:hypothetical protein
VEPQLGLIKRKPGIYGAEILLARRVMIVFADENDAKFAILRYHGRVTSDQVHSSSQDHHLVNLLIWLLTYFIS